MGRYCAQLRKGTHLEPAQAEQPGLELVVEGTESHGIWNAAYFPGITGQPLLQKDDGGVWITIETGISVLLDAIPANYYFVEELVPGSWRLRIETTDLREFNSEPVLVS